MPLRACLPKPATGPDKSWMVPIVISSLVTPCDWARTGVVAPSASAPSKVAKQRLDGMDSFLV